MGDFFRLPALQRLSSCLGSGLTSGLVLLNSLRARGERPGNNCESIPMIPLAQSHLHFPSEAGSPLFLQHKRNRGKERRDCDNTIRRKRPIPKRGLGLNQDQHHTEYNDADFPPG
jgi:hypothetical protein